MSRRVNQTGRRRSVKAPASELLERVCPHLAFVAADRYDRLIKLLDARNERFRRGYKSGVDCRKDVCASALSGPASTSRVASAGVPITGVGTVKRAIWSALRKLPMLECRHVRRGLGRDASEQGVLVELETLPDFDPQFRAKVADELTKARDNYGNQRKHLEHRLAEFDRKVANLAEAIASLGGSPALTQQLRDEEARKADLIEELRVLDELPKTMPELPSIEEIKAAARAAIQRLATTDPEFGRLMKRLISQLIAYPVRLIDGGGLYLREDGSRPHGVCAASPPLGRCGCDAAQHHGRLVRPAAACPSSATDRRHAHCRDD